MIAIRSRTQGGDVQLIHHLLMILLRGHLLRRRCVLPAAQVSGKRRHENEAKPSIFHKVIIIPRRKEEVLAAGLPLSGRGRANRQPVPAGTKRRTYSHKK